MHVLVLSLYTILHDLLFARVAAQPGSTDGGILFHQTESKAD